MATLETVPKKEHCRMEDVYINVTLIEMTLQTNKNTQCATFLTGISSSKKHINPLINTALKNTCR